MTREEYQNIMIHSIEKTMQDNYDHIGFSLMRGVEENDDLLSLEMKMIRNAVSLSAQISVQLIGDMMEQAGIISFEEPEEEKPNLRIVPPPVPEEEEPGK